MRQDSEWLDPGTARSDGRLYYLVFESGKDERRDHVYFRAVDGDWYCLDLMGKAPAAPIAAILF